MTDDRSEEFISEAEAGIKAGKTTKTALRLAYVVKRSYWLDSGEAGQWVSLTAAEAKGARLVADAAGWTLHPSSCLPGPLESTQRALRTPIPT